VASDVYGQLEAQGFLVVEPRRTPVVAAVDQAPPAPAEPGPTIRAPRFDLTPTTPDVTLFPLREWVGALRWAASNGPARALDYGDPRGVAGLREALADHLGRTRGVVADPARIVVVQGAAQGLDLLLRVLSARGRRRIAVEDPSLSGFLRRPQALGLDVAGCRVDGEGIVVDGLDADAVLVTPAHQFPTGVVLGGGRRRALLDWARLRDGLLIEDDYDAEFRYGSEPVRALQGLDPARVAYLGTVSKTLAPALRLGWLLAPPELTDELVAAKQLLDHCSPSLDQLALKRLLESGAFDRHVRRARATYRRRRDRLAAALADHLPGLRVQGVAAGLHVLVELPAGLDDEAVAAAAARRGVRVEPVSRYAVALRHPPGLVVGYGRVHESAIEPAVDALAAAIRAA
jgi:GntR family transcriptional regulator/MocR family aminotransferase